MRYRYFAFVMALAGCLALVGTSRGQLRADAASEPAVELPADVLDLFNASEPSTGSEHQSRLRWQALEPDFTPRREGATGQPLWISQQGDSFPDLIQARLNTLLELNEILETYSTYSDENMRIELQLPRPGWSITIPIR